jgi:hypothetical protein
MRVYQFIAFSVLFLSVILPFVAAQVSIEKIKCPDGKKRL